MTFFYKMIFLAIHVPMVHHMAVILVLPVTITQRNAWQWGAGTTNGDNKNPMTVSGVHHETYRWEQI